MDSKVHVYKETREERNKRIAIEAIALASTAAAQLQRARAGLQNNYDLAADLDAFHARWEARDVNWTRPGLLDLPHDTLLTAIEMGTYVDKDPGTIRRWAYRGHIPVTHSPDGTPLYRVGDVLGYGARLRTGRHA